MSARKPLSVTKRSPSHAAGRERRRRPSVLDELTVPEMGSVRSERRGSRSPTRSMASSAADSLLRLRSTGFQAEYAFRRDDPDQVLYFVGADGILKGPVQMQMVLVYLAFFLVMLSAEVLEWAPEIRVAAFVPYAAVTFTLTELVRITNELFQPQIAVTFAMFTTLIPFGLACFFSREAHILISTLFFTAVMIVFLQSGCAYLQVLIMAYTVTFILEYVVLVCFMILYYTDTTQISSGAGRILDPPVQWGAEITVVFVFVLLGLGSMLLERFIQLYGLTLVGRAKEMERLEQEQLELQKELRRLKREEETDIDVEAPIQKVIAILKQVAADSRDPDVEDQIDEVIAVLNSNDLYGPDLATAQKAGKVDQQTSSWLSNLLHDGNKNVSCNGVTRSSGVAAMIEPRKVTRFLPVVDQVVEGEVNSLLDLIEDWNFDVFRLAEITNGRPLYFMGLALFERHDLFVKFGVEEQKLKRFLTAIEDGYVSSNPYHNSIHAADVLQTLNYFIVKGGLGDFLSELDILGALVGAIIHDFEHPGYNNAFHINTMHELAVRYNDQAVLENYHTAAAFTLMLQDPHANILDGLAPAQLKEIRETIISGVLATDMAQHFELLGHFKGKLGSGVDSSERKDRLLLLRIGIKCADISNPAKPTKVCQEWASRVMQEFWRQGDEERARGIQVSAFMDRKQPAVPKCQLGFIDFIVAPLYEAWASFLPSSSHTLDHLEENRAHWKGVQSEELRRDESASVVT